MPQRRAIVITFGRFQPPTTGHAALVKFVQSVAARSAADVRLFPSASQDAAKNPLPFAEKVRFLKMLFPQVSVNDNSSIRTPFDALRQCAAAGYTEVTIVVGSDRVADFEKFQQYILPKTSPKYRADTHIALTTYRVMPVPGVRDADDNSTSGMSASKQRAFAAVGDYQTFKQGVPTQNDRVARMLYNAVRQHMQIKESDRLYYRIQTTVTEDVRNTFRIPLSEESEQMSCPSCHRKVDKNAGWCKHCKQDIAEESEQMSCPSCHRKVDKNAGWCKHCKQDIAESGVYAALREAPHGMPLKGHAYHKKSDEELRFIIKDAGAAAYAMRGHNRTAEDKYLDQVNDASSVLYYRRQGGKRIAEADTSAPKSPSEVDRLKVRQKQDEITLKQRQANELMAAKLRDVQQKAREQQQKASAPKPASR